QKFPSFQIFRFAAGGVGGAANKNDRKFLGFAPRELVERGRGASVIRQNPSDFVRNTFELRPIHTAKIENRNWKPKWGRAEGATQTHSPHKILILQGFATLRVAPRLPIQFYE
ncbi:MAG: hypothetical protein KGJ58_04505, partial [Patescibacteria group bacterium]|nr:hypothetical protein [Patescibacteria group bacterium]